MIENNLKIIITGISTIDKLAIAKKIVEINDNISIVPKFTTDEVACAEFNSNYLYYLSVNDANLAYKNNALIYINTENYISKGITFDDMYNNDVACVDLMDFNNIPDRYFYEMDIIIVWIDSSKERPSKSEIYEVKCLEDRLKNFKYMYFVNESPDLVASKIVQYINNFEKRQELLEENS